MYELRISAVIYHDVYRLQTYNMFLNVLDYLKPSAKI